MRPLNQPQAPAAAAGAAVFAANCASCHGGAKWTKSQVLYGNNPAIGETAGTPPVRPARDPGLTITANQAVSYANPVIDPISLQFIENIGTFDSSDPSAPNSIEIRGAGVPSGAAGQGGTPLGGDPGGFNVPSLLGIRFHAPYFHDGAAQTLTDVFAQHGLGGGTIATTLNAGQQANLLDFLNSLDGRTPIQQSDGDIFKDPTRDL